MSEKVTKVYNGFLMLAVGILLMAASVTLFILNAGQEYVWMTVLAVILMIITGILILPGLFIVNPNEAKVMVLFGKYAGSVRDNGFFWANPFYSKKKISLRARNLSGQKLKVNDKIGNPIEIAAVIVWKVEDTFKAFFDVDNYEQYVVIQSEASVRHLAQSYPYDSFEEMDEEQLTLRASTDKISHVLESELQERLKRAGVHVIEARLSHLAYAPEIAEAMLRRQQATAVVAARSQIVHGAVSMVEMALNQLADKHLVDLDEEKKATMVSNLLVVLCSESSTSPVINTGTLYQ
ncbi:MAG: SPFH domain-containing protein [Dehalococcoidales bacterium]|nr:SPFH domain-containing protein [Dehalococcoidales bacterium]